VKAEYTILKLLTEWKYSAPIIDHGTTVIV